MKNSFKIILPLIALLLATGCVQKTKIKMKVPGEINLKGVHKIALLDFSSVKSNSENGIYKANKDLLKLAKDEVANIFYEEPYYAFSNLEIEKILAKKSNAKPLSVFDGMVYGKLWWQVTPEYDNIIPSKTALESYTIKRYVCGKTKKGRAIYCSARLTTKMKDAPFNLHYRVKNATLMMSLDLYKVSQNGKLSKVTEVFEVVKGKFEVKNGEFGKLISLVGAKQKLDKMKVLKDNNKKKGFFAKLLDKNAKVSKEVNTDYKVSNNLQTMPSNYTLGKLVIDKVAQKLRKMIAPTTTQMAIEIEKGDTKIEKMFDYSAFNAINDYIVNKLAMGNSEFYDGFNDADFINTTKEMLAFVDKKEFDAKNKISKKKETYKPIDDKELTQKAKDYLKDNAAMLYNYGLANEANGNFEKSLEIYRFLFNNIDSKNQKYANGIGRSLMALDMADKVSEEKRNKRKAKKVNSL